MDSKTFCVENANSKQEEKKRKEALACRDKGMTTWPKAGGKSENSDSGEIDRVEDCKEGRRKKKSYS